MECPKCKSPMIEGKKFWICEDCGEKIEKSDRVDEKKFKKMRLFLSYGHDRNQELVEKIKNDLEKLGHDVWFDKSSIKTGQDWRRAITDGILKSDWFFSFLSKHSIREPGVCLDEIGIALAVKGNIIQTILVESEQEVKPPVSISHIQWLDMHDWYERKQRNPEEFEKWYQEKFQEIVRVIHSDENIRFAGEIEKLRMILRPITMDAFIARLFTRDFTGRQWLVDEINNWVRERPNDRAFLITGKPGVGKSAFLAWLSHYNKADVLASYFLRYNQPEHSNPMNLIKTIAFQLAARLPDYRRFLLELPEIKGFDEEKKDIFFDEFEKKIFEKKNIDEIFSFLISEPLKNCIEDERNVGYILIDALDESPEVAELIARNIKELPQWIKLITTTRPDSKVMPFLKALNPKTLDANDVRNKEDIASYLRNKLAKLNPSKEEINKLVEKSEGIFLYAVYVAEQILEGKLFLDRLDELPEGLKGIYAQYFKRQFPNEDTYKTQIVPVLQVIFAALEPLKIEELREILDYTDQQIHEIILSFGSLFEIIDEKIQPFHRTLFDWATSREDAGQYYVSIRDGHVRIAEKGYEEVLNLFKSKKSYRIILNYYLKWLPMHFIKIEEYEKAVELLKDFNFMMERLKAGYLEALLQDYSETIKYLPDEERFKLKIEEAFFREKAHILRRGNEGWPSYKIFFQLAIEHADDSPLTKEAEKYLEEGKVNWLWLRRNKRPKTFKKNPFVIVSEVNNGWIINAIELSDGSIVCNTSDGKMSFFNKNGNIVKVVEGCNVSGMMELDNRKILSWSINNHIHTCMWDFEGTLISEKVIDGHSGYIRGVIPLRDGKIISWADDLTIRLWNPDGKLICKLEGHTDLIRGVIPLRDGKIVSWADDLTICLWNPDGSLFRSIDTFGEIFVDNDFKRERENQIFYEEDEGSVLDLLDGYDLRIKKIIELSDGSMLMYAANKIFRIYFENGNLSVIKNSEEYNDEIIGAIELSDNRILYWSLSNIYICDKNFNQIIKIKADFDLFGGVLELQNGFLLSWEKDKTLRLRDKKGNLIKTLRGHEDSIKGVVELRKSINENKNNVLSWSKDGTLRIWDILIDSIEDFFGHTDFVMGIIQLNNKIFISWGNDSKIIIWDRYENPIKMLSVHKEPVKGLIRLKSEKILSWSDSNVYLHDTFGKDVVSKPIFETNWFNKIIEVKELKNDNLIVILNKYIYILKPNGQVIGKIIAPEGSFFGAVELRDGRIISLIHDLTLRIWDEIGNLLRSILLPDTLSGVIELSDGRILCWCSEKILILNEFGEILKSTCIDFHSLTKVSELKDGRILLWSSYFSSLTILNVNGDIIVTLHDISIKNLISEENDSIPISDIIEIIIDKETVSGSNYLFSHGSVVELFNSKNRESIFWHCESKSKAHKLNDDGTAIISKDNGQICFLKLYKGKNKVSFISQDFV